MRAHYLVEGLSLLWLNGSRRDDGCEKDDPLPGFGDTIEIITGPLSGNCGMSVSGLQPHYGTCTELEVSGQETAQVSGEGCL